MKHIRVGLFALCLAVLLWGCSASQPYYSKETIAPSSSAAQETESSSDAANSHTEPPSQEQQTDYLTSKLPDPEKYPLFHAQVVSALSEEKAAEWINQSFDPFFESCYPFIAVETDNPVLRAYGVNINTLERDALYLLSLTESANEGTTPKLTLLAKSPVSAVTITEQQVIYASEGILYWLETDSSQDNSWNVAKAVVFPECEEITVITANSRFVFCSSSGKLYRYQIETNTLQCLDLSNITFESARLIDPVSTCEIVVSIINPDYDQNDDRSTLYISYGANFVTGHVWEIKMDIP